MIKAVMYWNRMRMEISGHANTAPKGQDIVCAAASMLTGALAGVLEEAQARGRTDAKVEDKDETLAIWADPIMGSMNEIKSYYRMAVKGLRMLQEEYPKNVEIKEVH